MQALPTDARPISSWLDDDQALADVAAGIHRVIEDMPLLAASAPRTNLPAIWNVPYQPNPFFLGRDEELAQLRSRLQAGRATAISQPQAISGLGGIGKTQLALEYAYRYHQEYQAVLWAGAENADALIASYIAIATLLRLPERQAKEQDIIVQAVKTWLQTHSSWLLILDNADELNLLPNFLPPSPSGHVLLTTRAAATGQLAHRMEIETLLPERGALFLLRRAALLAPDATLEQASQEERELALKVSQGLGGLPLALDQAGAYLEETGTDLSNYWQIYQQHRADLLRERRGLRANHPAPVATTWSLSFERVEEKNPAAADLLRLCAFLAPDAIPEEVLTEGTSSLGPLLAPLAADAFRLNQAIEALRAYSLVQRNPNPKEKSLSVHRLLQAVLQDALEETQRRIWAERAVRAIHLAFPKVDDPWRRYDTWSRCQRYLPHVQICEALIEEWNIRFPEAAELLMRAGDYLAQRTHYAQAEPLMQQALAISEQVLGPEHRDTATTLRSLAGLYTTQDKYKQAEPLYQRALAIYERMSDPDQSDIVTILHGLALLYWGQGKYEQAEPLMQRALEISEQVRGPDQPYAATPLRNLAALYQDQGKYEQAEPLYRRALAIYEQVLGPEHDYTAMALSDLAFLYQDQGNYEQAEPLYERALAVYERVLSPEHPYIAATLSDLAALYQAQGKYEQAEPHYQHALAIHEKSLGSEHPQVANDLNNLADLYLNQRNYAEAEPLYQRALHIWEQQLGPEHLDVAYPLSGLASLYYQQDKFVEAERFFQHALRIREASAPQHPETAETMYDLAQLREAQDNSEEARVWYARALTIREQALGAQHPKTTETRARLIALLHALEQHEEAAQLEAAQAES